ncbi:MAG: response regulator [Treponema sp.]|nr:response regulator [Treponema sp.]
MNFTAPAARILAVDDQEINLMVLEQLLSPTQMEVKTAASGQEMLDLLKQEHYDLVLLDHVMPSPDGLESFHLAQTMEGNLNTDTPFVALTGNDMRAEDADPSLSPREATRAFYKGEGFADYLPKPFLPQDIDTILRSLLPADKIILAEPAPESPAADGTAMASGAASSPAKGGLFARVMQLQGGAADVSAAPDPQDSAPADPQGYVTSGDPNLDTASGLAFSAGNADMYRELLTNWANAYMENGYTIQKSAKNGDLNAHRIATHSLKSSSRMVGAVLLGDMAEKAEHAARDGDLAYVQENVNALLEQYGKSVEAAEAYLAG